MLADLVYCRCDWHDESTTLLDFGCGHHGNLAAALCQYTRHTVAVDANPEAVNAFSTWRDFQGLAPDDVDALTTEQFVTSPQYFRYFDVITASLVFHHIDRDNQCTTASMLRQRMRANGVLVLIDVLKQGGSGINGFTFDELRDLLLSSGFSDVSVEPGPRIVLHSQKRTRLLIATAKP